MRLGIREPELFLVAETDAGNSGIGAGVRVKKNLLCENLGKAWGRRGHPPGTLPGTVPSGDPLIGWVLLS